MHQNREIHRFSPQNQVFVIEPGKLIHADIISPEEILSRSQFLGKNYQLSCFAFLPFLPFLVFLNFLTLLPFPHSAANTLWFRLIFAVRRSSIR